MSNRTYIRTDKNGTKIYHDYTCQRCSGKGVYVIGVCNMQPVLSPLDSGVCWDCGGSGISHKPTVIKEYTPEYRAKLDAQAEKRHRKKMAQAQAEKAEKQAEWKQEKGFVNDRIYVVGIEDSFEKKDEIKAAGGRYNSCAGWYFSEPHEEFQTVEMTSEECLIENAWAKLEWRSDIRETLKAKLPQKPASEHVGTVGEKVDMELTLTRTRYFDTRFGTTWVYTFEDAAGNVLVWKTSAHQDLEDGSKHRVKGTIKEHDEYRDVKQTVLTRCKIA